jgi:cytochrome c oxidase subunit 4
VTNTELESGDAPALPAGALAAEHAHAGPDAPLNPLGHHPLPYQYVMVAAFLAFVTGAEVGLYYLKINKVLFTIVLMVMMFVKFLTVAQWFMHLRFDSKIFRRLFVTGLVLAGLVYFAVLLTFHVLIG